MQGYFGIGLLVFTKRRDAGIICRDIFRHVLRLLVFTERREAGIVRDCRTEERPGLFRDVSGFSGISDGSLSLPKEERPRYFGIFGRRRGRDYSGMSRDFRDFGRLLVFTERGAAGIFRDFGRAGILFGISDGAGIFFGISDGPGFFSGFRTGRDFVRDLTEFRSAPSLRAEAGIFFGVSPNLGSGIV